MTLKTVTLLDGNREKQDFTRPCGEISNATKAYPADVKNLMPAYDQIPEEIKNQDANNYTRLRAKWFLKGLMAHDVPEPRGGIDGDKAWDHLFCIQRSFEPKHEHKSAAVAYLMSLWFKEPVLDS